MDKLYDTIIIGGGPAGYSAALYCARAALKTLVLEKLSPGGQMATTYWVENYPGFDEGIEGFDLAENMQQGAERFGAQTEYEEAVALDLKANPKKITTTNGEYYARTVILAMGATHRELGLSGERELRGRGVAYCATCDGMRYKGMTVAVAGGGDSAAADATVLAKLCKKVYVIHRRDELRASVSYREPMEAAGNIELFLDTRITGLNVQEGVFKGVSLVSNKTGEAYDLACDGLFIAIGRTPDTSLAAGQTDTDDQGYIIADETTRTNIPGVFAVGDVRTKPLRQIVTAAADGAVAAMYVQEFLKAMG